MRKAEKAPSNGGLISKILNKLSKLTNDVDKINSDLHYQYSTDEVDTGRKWIDGKTIYRKSYDTTSVSNGTILDPVLNMSYIDTIISTYGSYFTSSEKRPLPTTNSASQLVTIYSVSNGLKLLNDVSQVNRIVLTIEFTKQ